MRSVLLATVCLLGWPASVSGQATLSVYGPEGTARERRVMAVVTSADGTCVPASTSLQWSAEGGEVVPEDAAGHCVRWLRLSSPERSGPSDQDVLRLHVSGPDLAASAVVPMRDATRLDVRARRVGRLLRVAVEGASGDALSGFVVATSGTIALEPTADGLRARVPPGLLGVVVRTGTMVGVTAVRPRARPAAPEVLVLASDRAIEGGGPPREVAFVVASDGRGRLSQELPLTIQSERGELRSLRWIGDGVAAIGLSAPTSTRSIDLSVGHEGHALTRVELDVAGDWPVSAEITTEDTRGGFVVEASAVGANGDPVPSTQLRARCGDSGLLALPAQCNVPPGSQADVVVLALVDGRPVPLASHRLVVPALPTPVQVAPPAALPPRWSLVAFLRGTYDVWERGGLGGGVRGAHALVDWLRLGVSLGYDQTFWESRDASDQSRVLRAERASVGASVFGELVFGEDVGGAVRLEVGGGWTGSRGTLDGVDEQADVAHFTALLAGGPRFRFGAFLLGADAVITTGIDSSVMAWERAPVSVSMEVHGGVLLP
ncbi:MAG: hypothetical protein AB8I08_02395 [Sandaracinaceae bacterium]